VQPECTRSEDCPQGHYCDLESYGCRSGCDHSDQCEPGFFCDLVTHQCTRDPDAPAELGEPCHFVTDFGTTHPEANNCQPHLRCIAYAVEGAVGYCPGHSAEECWMVRDVYNRDCVNGVCGGSFCCELCSAGSCEPGFEPLELQSGDCVCLPLPWDEGCHPVLQDCPPGENCITYDGPDTWCIPAGYVNPGQPCDSMENQLCQAGFQCIGSGDSFNCEKLCDMNDSSTCEPGTYCAPIADVERWGFCEPEGK
jgi:hypothetical protein